jgi:hypothetical protein
MSTLSIPDRRNEPRMPEKIGGGATVDRCGSRPRAGADALAGFPRSCPSAG